MKPKIRIKQKWFDNRLVYRARSSDKSLNWRANFHKTPLNAYEEYQRIIKASL